MNGKITKRMSIYLKKKKLILPINELLVVLQGVILILEGFELLNASSVSFCHVDMGFVFVVGLAVKILDRVLPMIRFILGFLQLIFKIIDVVISLLEYTVNPLWLATGVLEWFLGSCGVVWRPPFQPEPLPYSGRQAYQ